MPSLVAALPGPGLEVPPHARDERVVQGVDNCRLDNQRFFLRANLVFPVTDCAPLIWSIWIEIEHRAYKRVLALWTESRRMSEPPTPGTLANEIPGYPPALGLPGHIMPAPPGSRAHFVLERSEHLLCVDSHNGINRDRLESLMSRLG